MPRCWAGVREGLTLSPPAAAVAPDPCASSPCRNGGSCAPSQDPAAYHCTCPAAFTGRDCGTGEQRPGPGGNSGGGIVRRGCAEQGDCCRPQKDASTRRATSTCRWASAGPACARAAWSSASAGPAGPGARTRPTQVQPARRGPAPWGWVDLGCSLRRPGLASGPAPVCQSSPCLNGGTCHLIVATGTTVCACPPGYAGRLCNIGE